MRVAIEVWAVLKLRNTYTGFSAREVKYLTVHIHCRLNWSKLNDSKLHVLAERSD